MITSRGIRYYIAGQSLSQSIYTIGEIKSGVDTFDLRGLSDITTIEPIEIDAERQGIARSGAVRKGVVTGAAIGAAVDAINPGDSIMDGLLIGAIAGILFTADKKEPVAHLVLRFTDGTSLPVVVGREDLSQLVSIVEDNRANETDNLALAHRWRPMTPEEIRSLSRYRARKMAINVALLLFLVSFMALALVFDPVGSDEIVTFVEGMSAVFAGIGKAVRYSVAVGGLVGVGYYIISLRSYSREA